MKLKFVHLLKIFILRAAALILIFPVSVWAESEFLRSIGLSWEPTASASSYELEITSLGNSPPLRFYSKEPEWKGNLALGKYSFRVRGRDQRKVPGEWSENSEFAVRLENVKIISPIKNKKVMSSEEDNSTVSFKWESVPGAKAYHWEIRNEKNDLIKEQNTDDTSVSVNLDVAKTYTWKVKALAQAPTKEAAKSNIDFDSPTETVSTFALIGKKLDQPNPQKPQNPFVREIRWEKVPLAESYEFILSRWDSGQRNWIVQDHKSTQKIQAPFSLQNKGGRYRLQVRAQNALRVSSNAAEIKFDAHSGDRSPAAEEHALIMESVDHTTGYFAVMSYLITGLSYQGQNWDHTSSNATLPSASFNSAIGGTGRVGLGYLSSKSSWGFLGIADYGGVSLNGNIANFASLETNGVYRSLVGSAGELRQFFGLFYKQYPNLIPELNSSFSISTVATLGPHYGAEYWYALNRKLGFQVNGQAYLNALTASTPNGNPVTTSLSYQLGFLASYRLGLNVTGLIGYAFRNDSVTYSSTSNNTNSITMTGNYLNLVLEWAL